MKFNSIAAIIATFPAAFAIPCPGGFEIPKGLEAENHASWVNHKRRLEETSSVPPPPEPTSEYMEAVNSLDIDAVKEDLIASMTDSQDFWPAGEYSTRILSNMILKNRPFYVLTIFDTYLIASLRIINQNIRRLWPLRPVFHPPGLALQRHVPRI